MNNFDNPSQIAGLNDQKELQDVKLQKNSERVIHGHSVIDGASIESYSTSKSCTGPCAISLTYHHLVITNKYFVSDIRHFQLYTSSKKFLYYFAFCKKYSCFRKVKILLQSL